MDYVEITDFPKLHSPFKRAENEAGEYVVYDEVNDGYEWVFEDENVRAVEKLDGTNVSVVLDSDGNIEQAFTRMGDQSVNPIDPWNSEHPFLVRGIQNAVNRGWLDDLTPEEQHYGELIGPKVNGNPYELDEHLFVPFDYLYEKVYYKSWGDYPKTYDVLSGWFEENLIPLFYARMHNLQFDEIPDDAFVEGIVFTHDDGRKAKLRRDMFDWYDGERH